MTAATFTQPLLSLTRLFGSWSAPKARRTGPMPTWIGDDELRRQLLKDTGLSAEDLGFRPTWNERLPFFMQQSQW